jgi:phytoene dehydrogenase-like protein
MGGFWQELGLLRGQKIIDSEIFQMVEGADGRRLTFYTDPQRLKAEMLRLAPEDAAEIERFIALIERFRRPDSPVNLESPAQAKNLGWLLAWLPTLLRYGRLTVRDYSKRFKNPFLSWALQAPWGYPGFAFLTLPITLAWLAEKNAGYPLGGSLKLVEALQRRATELGCRVHLGVRVERVLVEGNQAVGVRLANGEEHRTDYVVGAGDLHSLMYELLDGGYGSAKQKAYFGNLPLFESIMVVSYGVKQGFADFPQVVSNLVLKLPAKRTLAGSPIETLSYRVYNFDPTLAPEGSTVVQVTLNAPYEHWHELKQDPERYAGAKRQVAEECADLLEARFPGFKEAIEVIDVASPTTFERYTANWRGSFEGWLITPKTMTLNMPKTLEGLDRLYLAGQWVQPGGGLPTGAMTGRQTVQTICKRDGKEFRAEKV